MTKRRLTAIMAADVASYSRLMHTNEERTHVALSSIMKESVAPTIVQHGGRIVKSTGDGFLADFPSAIEAVRCALHFQDEIARGTVGDPPEERIVFRVGINLGDVIIEDEDIFGDGVNMAARLEALAEPGGLLISAAVHDQVRGRIKCRFDDLGEKQLKNIAAPVRVYRVVGASEVPAPVLALPDKPSVAVLPFHNMSPDPEQEHFADGLVEEITTALSRNHYLFVIARNSSFSFKNRSVDVKQIARELGVRYVVEGSVRRDSTRIRITAQLIDAETGVHVWAGRFDRDLADIFVVQDEITRAVVTAIDPAISRAERERAMRKPPDHLSAWEAYQHGLSRWLQRDFTGSRVFLQRSVTLDPRYAPPHAMLARLTLAEALYVEGLPMMTAANQAEAEARIAIDVDPDLAFAHGVLAWVFTLRNDFPSALEEAETAIALNPNEPWGYLDKGRALVFSGRHIEAHESFAIAERLDPRGPTAPIVMHLRALASYLERDYLTAEAMARRAIRTWPAYEGTYPVLAAALGQLDRPDEARLARDSAKATSPWHFNMIRKSPAPYYRKVDHEHLLDGLRKAGWYTD